MRRQFKDTVTALATDDPNVVVILGDISHYLFAGFQERFPNRFFNMGICENALISITAGLSAQGLHPFVHTIAPFITERSFEQIKLDMCYNEFGGNIVSCGSSFDYAWDGATHHAYTDLAILRMLPGMEVVQPGSRKEVDTLLRSQYRNGKPTYFKLSDHPHSIDLEVEFGKGVILKEGSGDLTVITAGPLLANVIEGCKDLPVNLLYFPTIKPMDTELIHRFRGTRLLVVHDGFGLREAVNEVPGLITFYHGIPDQFCVWYGTVHDIRREIGLDPGGIRNAVSALLTKR
jgi:transketolase